MEKYYDILSKCPLFYDVNKSELHPMLVCLDAKTIDVPKGSSVFLEGDAVQYVGVVLSGMAQVVREDYYGNRSIMSSLQPGEIFAETFSFAGLETMPVSVIATKDSEVLLLDCRRVLTICSNACHFHSLLLKNLLQAMARKNLNLSRKIRYMSQKTTREKLMAYLLDQAKQHGSKEFVIPYDRQALADYLGVERSAMSVEISKLKRDGQIDTKGSWFRLMK
ncbi:MAG: Crp/Fnr family transcriptional regulator [Lachnospiraceae bacterium]|nr:Crp/Fnr family transcriptional regulator [Lachnospiraceae bacterium]